MTEPQRATFSISVRLRRTIVEEGYVSVPVTNALLRGEPEADGSLRMDTDALMAEALRLGGELDDWQVESTDIAVHPIQQARPLREGERTVPHDEVPPLFTSES